MSLETGLTNMVHLGGGFNLGRATRAIRATAARSHHRALRVFWASHEDMAHAGITGRASRIRRDGKYKTEP